MCAGGGKENVDTVQVIFVPGVKRAKEQGLVVVSPAPGRAAGVSGADACGCNRPDVIALWAPDAR